MSTDLPFFRCSSAQLVSRTARDKPNKFCFEGSERVEAICGGVDYAYWNYHPSKLDGFVDDAMSF